MPENDNQLPLPVQLSWNLENHSKVAFGTKLTLTACDGYKMIKIGSNSMVTIEKDDEPHYTRKCVMSEYGICAQLDPELNIWGTYFIARQPTPVTVEYFDEITNQTARRIIMMPEIHLNAVNSFELTEDTPSPPCSDDDDMKPECTIPPTPDPDPTPDPTPDPDPEPPLPMPDIEDDIILINKVIVSKTMTASSIFNRGIVTINMDHVSIISPYYNELTIKGNQSNQIDYTYISEHPTKPDQDMFIKIMFKPGSIQYISDGENADVIYNRQTITQRIHFNPRVDYIEDTINTIAMMNPDVDITDAMYRELSMQIFDIICIIYLSGDIRLVPPHQIMSFIMCYITSYNNQYFTKYGFTNLAQMAAPLSVVADDTKITFSKNDMGVSGMHNTQSCITDMGMYFATMISSRDSAHCIAVGKASFDIQHGELVTLNRSLFRRWC